MDYRDILGHFDRRGGHRRAPCFGVTYADRTGSGTGAEVLPQQDGDREVPDAHALNPRYTFDAFVIGASNRFAHAAVQRVAETPAISYNPLFIHGASGLGKTHLLHAIGHYVQRHFPNHHLRYVSTETFMNEFVESIRTDSGTVFKRRYRDCDILLVDDIEFLENKEGLQDEFFHTFNSLYETSKQIVLTSDRHPRSMATLEDRLRSRFEWGLITDVQPPDLETRLAIVRNKAQGEHADISDDVLEFIATHVTDNIRELEGALNRVSAHASLNQEPLTLAEAQMILSDLMTAAPSPRYQPDDCPRGDRPRVRLYHRRSLQPEPSSTSGQRQADRDVRLP